VLVFVPVVCQGENVEDLKEFGLLALRRLANIFWAKGGGWCLGMRCGCCLAHHGCKIDEIGSAAVGIPK
jgi:hypothetical protein